ncbi:Protein of unknown function [Tistlia consotensis]|uniref:DUF2783 domain-containing protein n=1 Tax=Tistlia consotensis USBA 355 TaxID=560819 RepID=A0A1Y6BBW2_9PROT|nr:DUF2783 domain-containing protein [Tistlia consotensis]SME92901.1 Protein of unknown function [Tistlia consotensis USBA 355]SNR28324.1 Protein of unknown function [Tistlia consotensis]
MTAHLETGPRLDDPDALYEALMAAYRDLPDAEALKLSAKLVLLLANHIGDAAVVREALAIASGRTDG